MLTASLSAERMRLCLERILVPIELIASSLPTTRTMNPLLPLNEIYRHYLDRYFHETPLSEPPHTRSELEHVLKLLPVLPNKPEEPANWLECLTPAWLQGESDAEPFPQNHEANGRWRATQQSGQTQREMALRRLARDSSNMAGDSSG